MYILVGSKVGLGMLGKCLTTSSPGRKNPYIIFPDALEKLFPLWRTSVYQVRVELKEMSTISLVSQREQALALVVKETCGLQSEYFDSQFQRWKQKLSRMKYLA